MGYSQYIIELTNTCNFACRYCYLSESEKLDAGGPRVVMSEETGEAVIDYLGRMVVAGRLQTVIVDFLDGEPLLNAKVLKHMVQHGRSLEQQLGEDIFIFRFTTNGSYLTGDLIEFCSKWDIYFNISVDGIPESHDLNRLHATGKPTSREVHHKLDWVAGRQDVGIVSTYTPSNSDRIAESVQYFMERDLRNLEISFAQGLTRYDAAAIDACVQHLSAGLDLFLERYEKHDFRYRCNELDNQLTHLFSGRRNQVECSYPYRISAGGKIEGCDRIPKRHNCEVGTVFDNQLHGQEHFCRSHAKVYCHTCGHKGACTPCVAYVESDAGLLQPEQPRVFCAVSRTFIDKAREFYVTHQDDPVVSAQFDMSKSLAIGLNVVDLVNASPVTTMRQCVPCQSSRGEQ